MATGLLNGLPMLVFGIVALLTTLMLRGELPLIVAKAALPVHEFCLENAPESPHVNLYRALVCGARLTESVSNDFRATGLLHVIVVSGSHLVFLEHALAAVLPSRPGWRLPIGVSLFVFTLAANAEPPVLRAFLHWALRTAVQSAGLGWTPCQTILVSSLATLPFCGSETALRSLSLGWIASLALSGFRSEDPSSTRTSKIRTSWFDRLGGMTRSALATQLRVYLLIAPALLGLSLPHPTAVVCNWLLAPLLGAGLFPASLLAFAISAVVPGVDYLWDLVLFVIEGLSSFMPSGWQSPASTFAFWAFYVAILNGAAIAHERRSPIAIR